MGRDGRRRGPSPPRPTPRPATCPRCHRRADGPVVAAAADGRGCGGGRAATPRGHDGTAATAGGGAAVRGGADAAAAADGGKATARGDGGTAATAAIGKAADGPAAAGGPPTGATGGTAEEQAAAAARHTGGRGGAPGLQGGGGGGGGDARRGGRVVTQGDDEDVRADGEGGGQCRGVDGEEGERQRERPPYGGREGRQRRRPRGGRHGGRGGGGSADGQGRGSRQAAVGKEDSGAVRRAPCICEKPEVRRRWQVIQVPYPCIDTHTCHSCRILLGLAQSKVYLRPIPARPPPSPYSTHKEWFGPHTHTHDGAIPQYTYR